MLVTVQLSVWDCISRQCSNRAAVISAPDDHFTAGPHCCVKTRAEGAFVVLVAVQLSVLGLYLPPVFKADNFRPRRSFHCRSRLPCDGHRPTGALAVVVAVHVSSVHSPSSEIEGR